jgi:ComF family protein
MPTFKPLHSLLHLLRQQLPCQLCGIDQIYKHEVCQTCWQTFTWQKDIIIRQEQSIHVACAYTYPIDSIIQKFKYEQQLHYQNLLAGLLQEIRLPKVQAIVPMPISNTRLIERGYNQSLLIAENLSQKMRVPIWQPVERLAQHSQKGLSRLERLSSIDQQFKIKSAIKHKFKKVLIIDDVVTTGSSIHALRVQLEKLGCTEIHAACIAAGLGSN